MTDQRKAPLFDALRRHAAARNAPFHIPGHKQRASANFGDAAARRFFGGVMEIDLTELADTDNLHRPEGVIAEAERLAAACFGAEETCFLVGGSTAGNLAMVLAACEPGGLVLVQRNVHQSIFHGLMLAEARAVILPPVTDGASGLAAVPDAETVAEAVRKYPEARALILCNPNYYGMSADLAPLVELAHRAGMPVLVDEAHGPHFGFHPTFPRSALAAGADAVVHSAHKMLSALTMGAMLHMQGHLISRSEVRRYLRLVQSSSPSYPVMASLDLARRELATRGGELFRGALTAVRRVMEALRELPFGVPVTADFSQAADRTSPIRQDPLKLVLFDRRGRLDGFRLAGALAAHGCPPEMADSRHAVLALGPGTTEKDGERLIAALWRIAEESDGRRGTQGGADGEAAAGAAEGSVPGGAGPGGVPEPVSFSRRLLSCEAVPLHEAAGRTAGEWIIPYPPGVPLIVPGERITERHAAELACWREGGAGIQGAADPTLRTVLVVRGT
jgi:arginine/lysine/ornithine decarboxylase